MHSDASYIAEEKGLSRIGGHYFLGSVPSKTDSIKINGTIHTVCSIIKHVAATEVEVQLGVSFNKARILKRICLTLIELGYPQPPTPLHNDNSIASGIVTNTVKRQISQAMYICYFLLLDQVDQCIFALQWDSTVVGTHGNLNTHCNFPGYFGASMRL